MKAIYVFVRSDLPWPQKVVQSSHAVLESTRAFVTDRNRVKIIVVSARSESKLLAIVQEAADNGIRSVAFQEADMNNQVTAVATEPIDDEQRKVFGRYKLLESP